MRLSASPLGLTASLLAGLALCACRGPRPHAHAHQDHGWSGAPMSVSATLVCPESFGDLTRTAQAGDGQSCAYRGDEGEQVEIKRMLLAGQSAQTVLAPTEAALKALVPVNADSSSGHAKPDKDDDDDDSDGADRANVDLPGVHVKANGDKADVNVFGLTVHADGDNANVNVGHGKNQAVVTAGPGGAEIHANSVDSTNASLVLILASDHAGPTGLRAAGYLAKGPVSGPLAVVTFKSDAQHGDWRDDHDLNGLLDLNVKQ